MRIVMITFVILLIFLMRISSSQVQNEQIIHFPVFESATTIVKDRIQPKQPVTVEMPTNFESWYCGFPYTLARRKVIDADGNEHSPYYLNATADRLEHEGFTVKVLNMSQDQIKSMSYTNGSFSGSASFVGYQAVLPVGGRPALKIRAHGMALIGERKRGKTLWICDGVLISNQWVLSAAHCFLEPGIFPNVIRLGEYDLSTNMEFGEFRPPIPYYDETLDYEIIEMVPYPDFVFKERYHDLILLKMHKNYPRLSYRIQPLCLPWGENKLEQDLVGLNLTMTGWGTTKFGSFKKSEVLLEVDLDVFDTKFCNESYSNLVSFQSRYPEGMTKEDILCAGSLEGGRDACKGDSGGPLVFQKTFQHDMVLTGIVSGGHGCGLKEYPGLYIPIYQPKYLQWIKDVAFA